jgi:hypothetical protein
VNRLIKRKRLLLLLTLVFMFIIPTAAQARLIFCRSDPVVILSNGTILDLSADVSTLLFNVREVHYELHVPRGVRALVVIHTPAWITSKETFTLIADQPENTYVANTVAHTRVGGTTVTANLLLLTALGIKLDYANASGPEGTNVYLRVDH